MRISDWSSDVCSSDLMYVKFGSAPTDTVYDCRPFVNGNNEACSFAAPQTGTYHVRVKAFSSRSEEHTSELQSLMRISYAVFCLKKKKDKQKADLKTVIVTYQLYHLQLATIHDKQHILSNTTQHNQY